MIVFSIFLVIATLPFSSIAYQWSTDPYGYGTEAPLLSRDTMIAELNDMRRDAAIKYKIGNMQKLVYDAKLTKMANSSCFMDPAAAEQARPEPDPYRTFSFRYVLPAQSKSLFLKELAENADLGHMERFLPHQRTVGYGIPRSDCQNLVFGPHGTWKYSDFVNGPAGSACDKGQTNENGLCAGNSAPPESASPRFQPQMAPPSDTTTSSSSSLFQLIVLIVPAFMI